MLRVDEPVIIIGDIHGQFYDMIHMFEKVVDPKGIPETNLLFLGDYVDRGIFSLEVCIFLFCLKLNHPKNVIMLRGNHESRAMTEHFTFRSEILQKFHDEEIYEKFIEAFESMPIAADVNGDYLCMHGGISPELKKTSDISKINRHIEPPLKGFLCDLLWSDPMEDRDARKGTFTPNSQRECSVKFGLTPVKEVLRTNNFISVIRAHQVQVDGYKMHRWGGAELFPSVITVFSAPNYCGEYHNKGAVILIENDKMNIKQYKDVTHPFHLPQGMDLFKWSIPFLMEKITDMLGHMTKKIHKQASGVSDEKVDVDELLHKQIEEAKHIDEEQDEKRQKFEKIRQKILTIGRMQRILKTLR